MVDGVDFVPEAIALAQERVQTAGLSTQVRLFTGSVAAMPFLEGPYDLAIDIGCMHGLEGADLQGYAREVARLVRPDGRYVLFAHLREREQPEESGPASIPRATLLALLEDSFQLERLDEGTTEVGGNRFASAWLSLRRLTS